MLAPHVLDEILEMLAKSIFAQLGHWAMSRKSESVDGDCPSGAACSGRGGGMVLKADFVALVIADEMLATRGVLSLVGAIL